MAGKSASSTWLPGGESAASKAGLGDKDIQKTVSSTVSAARNSNGSAQSSTIGSPSAKMSTAASTGAGDVSWGVDRAVGVINAPGKTGNLGAPNTSGASAAIASGINNVAATKTTGTVRPGTRTPSQAATPTQTSTGGPVAKDALASAWDTATGGPTAKDGPAAGVDPKTGLAIHNPHPTSGSGGDYTPGSGSGGGSGGGSPAAAAPVDTTPVASPTDYYGSAAETTKRITNGVDTAEQIAAADKAWSDVTRGFEQSANDILTKLQSVTEQDLANYAESTGQTIADATAQINQIIAGLQDKMQPAEAGRVGRVDTVEEENLLNQIVEAQKQESENQINYAVQQGVNDLTRAEEDAQEQFQTQRNQIAANERQALDNSALYSEMRGDRGGIGKAQYDSIQNTAATNQLTVNKEQTKLATDTARQIADLRAKGEFQKADELLKITQSYLGKLMELKQWADQANISIDEFNIGVDQWEQEYNRQVQQTLGELGINAAQYEAGLNLDREKDLQGQRQSLNNALAQYGLSNAQYTSQSDVNRISSILSAEQANANNKASTEMAAANITGAFSDATPTQQARARAEEQLAAAGQAMLSAGLTPSDAQLSAMGWTKDQFNAYKAAADAAKKRGGGSGTQYKLLQIMRDSVEAGYALDEIKQALDAAVKSGNYAAADSSKSVEFVGGLEGNYTGWRTGLND